jgi:hypothetical protein
MIGNAKSSSHDAITGAHLRFCFGAWPGKGRADARGLPSAET